jgi:hypothetical protein
VITTYEETKRNVVNRISKYMIKNGIQTNTSGKKQFFPYGNKEGKSAYIKTAHPIVMLERYFRLLEIKANRNAGFFGAARSISVASKVSWKIAHKQSGFHARGKKEKATQTPMGHVIKEVQSSNFGFELNTLGWSKKQEAELHAMENTNDNGFGVGLDMQALYECFLAARAACLGGFTTPTGKVIEAGYTQYVAKNGKVHLCSKAGNSASATEIRRNAKEPLFDDITKAQIGNDKAWKARREDLAESPQTIDVEQFGEDTQARRNYFAKMLRFNRSVVTSHVNSKACQRPFQKRNGFYRLLKDLTRYGLEGTLCLETGKGSCSWKHRLMNELKGIIKVANGKLQAGDLQDIMKKTPALQSKPKASKSVEIIEIDTLKSCKTKKATKRVLVSGSYTTWCGIEVSEVYEDQQVVELEELATRLRKPQFTKDEGFAKNDIVIKDYIANKNDIRDFYNFLQK